MAHCRGRCAAAAAVAIVLATGCSITPNTPSRGEADLILTSARIHTVEAASPWAEAVAIADGKFIAVGTAAEVARLAGARTRVIDLGGRLVLPGFGDAHVHPVFAGVAYSSCSLHDGKSLQDYQRLIAGCMAKLPGSSTIYGVGWEDSLFHPRACRARRCSTPSAPSARSS